MARRWLKAFYVFDEHTDYVKECQKIGLSKTIKYDKAIEEWIVDDRVYKRLDPWECYSFLAIVLMQLPEPSFDVLFEMALKSKDYGEKYASLGIILAKHEKLLAHKIKTQRVLTREMKNLIKEIIRLLNHSTVNEDFSELLALCDSITRN